MKFYSERSEEKGSPTQVGGSYWRSQKGSDPRSGSYRVAAIQMTAGSIKRKNLARAKKFISEAAKRNAKLVALPEVFAWRGPAQEQHQESETIPGPTSEFLCNLSRAHSLYILGGSFLERSADKKRSYNTSLLIGPSGKILAKYRKIHLFDVEISGKIKVKESSTKKAGDDIVAHKTPLGMVGLSICYDLRFPELYRTLADKGVELFIIPSAFTFLTGKAHWESLIRARAIENQAYVIAPNQIGKNPYGFADYGNSMIVDPWGKILAKAPAKECLITAEINLDYLASVRAKLPSLAHRLLSS